MTIVVLITDCVNVDYKHATRNVCKYTGFEGFHLNFNNKKNVSVIKYKNYIYVKLNTNKYKKTKE